MAHIHVRPHINNIDYFRNSHEFRVGFFQLFMHSHKSNKEGISTREKEREICFSPVVWIWDVPIGSWACMTGPKQLTPFEEVMEPSAGGTLMRESHYWGLALRLLSLAPILLPFLCADWTRSPAPSSCCCAFPAMSSWNRHPNPFSPSSLTTETESDWCILQNRSANLLRQFPPVEL